MGVKSVKFTQVDFASVDRRFHAVKLGPEDEP
jgi:hypothetical protein